MKKLLLSCLLTLFVVAQADIKNENIIQSVESSLKNERIIRNSTLDDLQVNTNVGKADDSKIVLIYLTWNVSNSAKQTQKMLQMYSARLANSLTPEDNISEIVIFWKVPYHNKDTNIAKFNYSIKNNELYIDKEWFSPVLH